MRSRTLLVAAAGTLVGAVSNVYWWCRTQTARESLAISADRDEAIERKRARSDGSLESAARQAGVEPAELPACIDSLRENISTLERKHNAAKSEIGSLRNKWAERWWQARTENTENARAFAVTIDGDAEDAHAIAKHASAYNPGVTIVTTEPDHAFVVTVGDAATHLDATELAAELTDAAGGGSGGSPHEATGGGASAELAEAATDLADRLSSELR